MCLRMYESEGLALPFLVTVGGLMLTLETFFFSLGWGATARPFEWQLNHWLLLVLGACYAVSSFLRARGAVDAAAGRWFVLAAYGLWMRHACFVVLFGFLPSWGDRSMGEDFAGDPGSFLIDVHRYGALLVFALGLGMVAWCSRPITAAAGRAGSALAGGVRGAPGAARVSREDARPSGSRPARRRRTCTGTSESASIRAGGVFSIHRASSFRSSVSRPSHRYLALVATRQVERGA